MVDKLSGGVLKRLSIDARSRRSNVLHDHMVREHVIRVNRRGIRVHKET